MPRCIESLKKKYRVKRKEPRLKPRANTGKKWRGQRSHPRRPGRNAQRRESTGRERSHQQGGFQEWRSNRESDVAVKLRREGTVHFIWQCNEKILNMPILNIKLKFTEVTWLV